MPTERRRATRYPFTATAEITDTETEVQVEAHSGELSLFGCFVLTAALFPQGTRVRVRIAHQGTAFAADARVAYVSGGGMGLAFNAVKPDHQAVLETLLALVDG